MSISLFRFPLPAVLQKQKMKIMVSICPELLGGLTVPRSPAELVNGEVLTKDHRSVDKEFRDGIKIMDAEEI